MLLHIRIFENVRLPPRPCRSSPPGQPGRLIRHRRWPAGIRAHSADSQILAAYVLFLNGNQALNPGISSNNPGLELELGVFQYTRTLALGDPSCGVFLIALYGSTDGTYNLPLISRTGNSSVRRSAIPSGLISKSLSINAT